MRSAPNPVDEKAPARGRDDERDENAELDDDELGGSLPELVVDSDGDDEELPTDPYVAIDLPPDANDDGTEVFSELPIGQIATIDEDEPGAADDALGIGAEPLGDADVDEPDESLTGELGDGLDDASPVVDEDELPSLDGDEPGFDDDRLAFGTTLEAALESTLPTAAAPWAVAFVVPEREHCGALTVGKRAVVAGSNDLFWLDDGRETPLRIALDGTRISSIALVGEAEGVVLCVTAFGRLLRKARLGNEAERLVDWRRAAEGSGSGAENLELCQLGPRHPRSVLGRLTSGRLVRSDDEGSTFAPVAADITTLCISTHGDPVAVVSRDGARLGLSFDGGFEWQIFDLVSPAREVATGEAPFVSAAADVVVLADAERGLVVSADRGRSFRSVPGTSNVSTALAGTLHERAVAWAALYHEAEDTSALLLIDANSGSAEIVATLPGRGTGDADHDGELGRIERLAWDGDRLWAAGGFGVAVFRP